ncbi:MAG: AAA-like domain-containing protein [Ardenticatenaceae bacterium]
MTRNKEFGRLLRTGIATVAGRKGKLKRGVELEIGEALDYSVDTVQFWQKGHIPKVLVLQYLVRYCVGSGYVSQRWARRVLYLGGYPDGETLLADLFPPTSSLRLFLSYQRGLKPDESVALKVAQGLNEHYVFFDQNSPLARIRGELSQADCVIFLLSAESIHSEVVLQQLEMVLELGARLDGQPRVLPVWLAYRAGLANAPHPVLESLKWAFWQNEADTPRLIAQLKLAVAGRELPFDLSTLVGLCEQSTPPPFQPPTPVALPSALEHPEGALAPDSAFYMERDADRRACAAIARQGVTITIKGARQMGKSSLLQRLSQMAHQMGKRFVSLDCHLLHGTMSDEDTFFRHFCDILTYKMGQKNRVADYWALPFSNMLRCTEYVGQELLPNLAQPCVLALDGADYLFDMPFRSAFFAMLRTWHNNRGIDRIWRQLDLVVVTSTEPYYFIENLHQSPFNVGEVIDLQDFTPAQVSELNRRHGSPLSAKEEQQLMTLVQGHPYLVRQALYLVANQRYTPTDLFARATDDRGPFGDHLRALLWRLFAKQELRQGMLQVVHHHSCPDERLFFRLRGAGLVRRHQHTVLPRCPLYADFLRQYLHE